MYQTSYGWLRAISLATPQVDHFVDLDERELKTPSRHGLLKYSVHTRMTAQQRSAASLRFQTFRTFG